MKRTKTRTKKHPCGFKCTCQRKPSRGAVARGESSRGAAVSMIVPGVKLTGEALAFVLSEAAYKKLTYARVIEDVMRGFAAMVESKSKQK